MYRAKWKKRGVSPVETEAQHYSISLLWPWKGEFSFAFSSDGYRGDPWVGAGRGKPRPSASLRAAPCAGGTEWGTASKLAWRERQQAAAVHSKLPQSKGSCRSPKEAAAVQSTLPHSQKLRCSTGRTAPFTGSSEALECGRLAAALATASLLQPQSFALRQRHDKS